MVAGALCGGAPDAFAARVSGALSWDYSRNETNTDVSSVTQTGLGQNYRVNATGAVLTTRLATWNLGAGWRDNLASFSGSGQPSRRVQMLDGDVGLVLLPDRVPLVFNLRYAEVDNSEDGDTNSLATTASFNTRLPIGAHPLSISAYQTTQDTGNGDAVSRLVSLQKRFDLSRRSYVTGSYQFSRFDSRTTAREGHGVSLSGGTNWSGRLSSTYFGNVTSQMSSTSYSTGGQTLFLHNSGGAGLNYRRGAEVSANLNYSFSEDPVGDNGEIRTHLLSGRGNLRASAKTDLKGRFTVRRLELPTVDLFTATGSVGIDHRPRFGWRTGGQLGFATNGTSDNTQGDRNTVSASQYLSASHELDVMRISWGESVAYSDSTGDFTRKRLTSSATLNVAEKRLTTVRLEAKYRFTDIQESQTGSRLEPLDQEHALTLIGTVQPRRNVWREGDLLSGSVSAGSQWNQYHASDTAIQTTRFKAEANYQVWSGLSALAGYSFQDNSSDIRGTEQALNGSVSWSRRVLVHGSSRLSGDYRQSFYGGGGGDTREASLRWRLDYAIGLVRAALSANLTYADTGGANATDSNSVYLNITRAF